MSTLLPPSAQGAARRKEFKKRGGPAPWSLGFCTVQCYNEKKRCGTRAFPPGARNKIQRRRNYSMGLKEQIEKLNPYLRDSSYIKQNA